MQTRREQHRPSVRPSNAAPKIVVTLLDRLPGTEDWAVSLSAELQLLRSPRAIRYGRCYHISGGQLQGPEHRQP